NVVSAGLVSALTIGLGYSIMGSILVGSATGLTGMVFAGITAITVQINEFSRSAAGMAGAVLGATFLLRAIGDMVEVGGSGLSWASPLGWATQTAPYVHDRWAPFILSVALAAATIALAFVVQTKRDFGASLMPPPPGQVRGHPRPGQPIGVGRATGATRVFG